MAGAQELVSTDSTSGRSAIVEAAGETLWLYLTQPNSGAIASDCWLTNLNPERGPLTEDERARLRYSGLPLPAPPNALADPSRQLPTDPHAYRLEWSSDGEAVRALLAGQVVAFIHGGDPRGHHSNIGVECPWGHPFDERLHQRLFGGE